MMQEHRREVEEHNRRQRHYFERTVKPTMVPRDSPYLRRHVEEALCFGGISTRERVLEVGCGMGRYTLLLAERGVRVEGLDLSPVLLDRLRIYNRGPFDIPLHCGDAQNPLPELEGSFDAVLGFFVLHHLKDMKSFFLATTRLLRPGGRMIFLEPNAYNPLFYLQILITHGMTWWGDRGIIQMRPGVVLREMEGGGLRHLAMARFGFFPPFLANRRVGSRLESLLERFPLWRSLLPFQLFRGDRI